jgi:membrane protein DedA with SNARE-associated domain
VKKGNRTGSFEAMSEHIVHFVERFGHWGYLVIFLVVMVECQVLVGLFMPGETLVLVSGILAAQGVFELDVLIFVIFVAAVVGDSLGYELGRQLGRGWLEAHGPRFGLRRERLAHIEMFFTGHGGKSVLASHFMHLGRAVMPFLAGSARMPYLWFFVFNALGCALWAATFAMLGYFFDHGLESISASHRYTHVGKEALSRAAQSLPEI